MQKEYGNALSSCLKVNKYSPEAGKDDNKKYLQTKIPGNELIPLDTR